MAAGLCVSNCLLQKSKEPPTALQTVAPTFGVVVRKFGKLDGRLQGVNFVGLFPGERVGVVLAAEVAVVGCLAIDWAQQVELADDVGWLEGKHLLHRGGDLGFVDVVGAKVSTCTLTGSGWPMA